MICQLQSPKPKRAEHPSEMRLVDHTGNAFNDIRSFCHLAAELCNGVRELSNCVGEAITRVGEIFDGVEEPANGVEEAPNCFGELPNRVREALDGVAETGESLRCMSARCRHSKLLLIWTISWCLA